MTRGVSRRHLFTFWREPPSPESLLRPPGALSEELLVDTCVRCGACVETCPRQAIFALGEDHGRAAGTPAIRARQAPCVVCDGLACTEVCPSRG